MSFGLGVSFGRLCNRARRCGYEPANIVRWETEESVFWYEPGTPICGYNKSALDLPKVECEAKYPIFEYVKLPPRTPTLVPLGRCEPFELSNRWIEVDG